MHLNNPGDLEPILQKTHFILLVGNTTHPETYITKRTLIPVPPNDKNTHDIETIRNIETIARMKHHTPTTIVLEQAHLLTAAAENAFLKLLEEPNDNLSFLFIAPTATNFLKTTLSRAKLFYLKSDQPAQPSESTLKQARILVSGQQRDLIPLATTLAKSRERALEVTQTAIKELYRSQLKSPNPSFLARLQKLLALDDALKQGGHIKLQIVNMIQ